MKISYKNNTIYAKNYKYLEFSSILGFYQTIVEINVKSEDVKRTIIYIPWTQISIALKAKCTGGFNIGEIVGL